MAPIPPDAYRVLLTGFGPFASYTVNPSWLAVKPLHGEILQTDPTLRSGNYRAQAKSIHITSNLVPVTYKDVLERVPGFHARPPVLPDDQDLPTIDPPADGYDLVFHVGVAGEGNLRLETRGHKYGYDIADADGELAPIVDNPIKGAKKVESEAERLERRRLGFTANDRKHQAVVRGFGTGYEQFPEELFTDVDVPTLTAYLQQDSVYGGAWTSTDAGYYLCDFISYCSLAESERTTTGKDSRVFFMHCPPVDEDLSTDEVTEGIRRIIIWILSQ